MRRRCAASSTGSPATPWRRPGDVLAMALRVNALAPAVPQAGLALGRTAAGARLTRGARPGAAPAGGRRAAHRADAGADAGVVAGGGARHGRGRAAAAGASCRPPALRRARSRPSRPGAVAGPGRGRRALRGRCRRGLLRHAAGRRHRLGQDRGLPGGGGRMPRRRAAGAGAAAGDRAVVAVAGAVRPALRRRARGLALRPASRVRRITWRAVADGGAPVVVGARSALFLPFPDLGLVVVDEEHETAFKQEDGVVYHARDMAVVRARLCAAPAVLVSATPSLETLANVEAGRYRQLTPGRRHGGAQPARGRGARPARAPARARPLPRRALIEAVADTIGRGEQAMLFLNRRGYAPLTLCRACGHRMQCPNCTAWLVEHRARRQLACHHCGHTEPMPPRARSARRRTAWCRSARAWSASPRRRRPCSPRRACW